MSGTLLIALLGFGLSSFLVPGSPTPIAAPIAVPVPIAEPQEDAVATQYTSAQEAFSVGAAFYNSRNFKAARQPFEAALELAKDDKEMKLKAYEALIPSYRMIPEFEPFQEAAEYVLSNHHHDAHRSITRRSYLSFAFNRGQIENLVKRYDERLKKDSNDWLSLYMLSDIYTSGAGLPPSVEHSKRAIELIKQLTKVEAKRFQTTGQKSEQMTDADAVKISREKGKLASQYVRAKDYKNAAKLYEEIAPLDTTTHAWNLKEAANAMLKMDNKKGALRLALAAEEAPAEARNDQLTHFFERHMGDLFMQLDEPAKAIPHYKIAVQKTKIEGYVKDTKSSLQAAIERAGK